MLAENRELMDKIAAHLIEKETITGKEFRQIFRKEKGLPEPEEEENGKAEGDVLADGGKTESAMPETMEPGNGEAAGRESEAIKPEQETEAGESDRQDRVSADTAAEREERPVNGQPANRYPVGKFSNASGNFDETLQKKIDEQE